MTEDFESLRAEAEQALARARRALEAEIAQYPTPISGCDAQFNHLLAERARLARAMGDLRAPVFVPTPRTPTPSSGVESR